MNNRFVSEAVNCVATTAFYTYAHKDFVFNFSINYFLLLQLLDILWKIPEAFDSNALVEFHEAQPTIL